MQPTYNYNDLGMSEKDYNFILQADKGKPLRHPYEDIIPLEELKDLDQTNKSMLIGTPIICTKDSLITWNKERGDALNYEAIKINAFEYLSGFNKEEIEAARTKEPLLIYFINYYYDSPLETPQQKKEIIKNLTRFRHPKKYVYNFLTKTEYKGDPTPVELANIVYHRPYITNANYWELIVKASLEKVFTEEGLAELKATFDRVKPNTGSYLSRTIEEDVIRELKVNNQLYYNDPSIHNLVDVYKKNVEKLKEDIDQAEKIKNKDKSELEAYLQEYNTNIDNVKKQLEDREGLSFNELYIQDINLLTYYNRKQKVEEELQRSMTSEEIEQFNETEYLGSPNNEALARIVTIINAPEGTLDSFYYRLLILVQQEHNIYYANKSLEGRLAFVEKVNNYPNSREARANKLLEHLLQPQYFKRNIAQLTELEERAKGHIAQYSNNVLNDFIENRVSFKNVPKSELPIYESLAAELEAAKKSKADLEQKQKDIFLSQDELNLINKDLEAAKEKIKSLEGSIQSKGYITIGGTPYKAKIPMSAQGKEISLNETPNAVELIINNSFIATYPKTFDIDTLVNRKKQTIPGALSELTPDKADKLSAYIRLIIKRASNTRSEKIRFTVEELAKRLDITRKPGSEIRYLTTLLKKVELKSISLKGVKDGAIHNSSFIDYFSLENGSVNICLSHLIAAIVEKNDSKIWTNDPILTPVQELIDNKTAQLMNQLEFNEATGETIPYRHIAPISLVRGVSSFDLNTGVNNFRNQIGKPLAIALEELNNNPETLYKYDPLMISRLKRASKPDDLEDPGKIEFKDITDIPRKVIHQEENRKQYLSKHPGGYTRYKRKKK